MTGPGEGGARSSACDVFDFDADQHIDLTDFAGLQRRFEGE